MLVNECPRCKGRIKASFTVPLDVKTLDLQINTDALSEVEPVGKDHLRLKTEGEQVAELKFLGATSIQDMPGDLQVVCENGHTVVLFQNVTMMAFARDR